MWNPLRLGQKDTYFMLIPFQTNHQYEKLKDSLIGWLALARLVQATTCYHSSSEKEWEMMYLLGKRLSIYIPLRIGFTCDKGMADVLLKFINLMEKESGRGKYLPESMVPFYIDELKERIQTFLKK